MRRLNAAVLAIAMALLVVVAGQTPAWANDADGFGANVAGAYLGEVAIGDLILLRFTLVINADGTWSSNDTSDHTGTFNDTPQAGAWTKSGPRQIRVRSMGFFSDPTSPKGMVRDPSGQALTHVPQLEQRPLLTTSPCSLSNGIYFPSFS